MKNNLIKRSVTALFFVVIILTSIFVNQYTFAGIFMIITTISLIEFYQLTEKGGFKPQKRYGIIMGTVMFILSFLIANSFVPVFYFLLCIPLIIIMLIAELYRIKEHHFRCMAFTIFGVVYVAVPFSLMNFLLINPLTGNSYSYVFILSFFLIIWLNDTGAYIFGSNFGKNKLFPRISPKKTWEGTFGGVVTALLVGVAISFYFDELSLIQWIIFALITSVFGTYGDLVESMLKRRSGVKDSGHILPGHGGMLDRFDSALFAAPMVFIFLKIVEILN